MAEGGIEENKSIANNLCGNEEEKMINGKDMNVESTLGFPELEAQCQSQPYLFQGNAWSSTGYSAQKHTQYSTTELKRPLDNGPPLTPAPSQESINRCSGQDSNCSADVLRPSSGSSESSSVQLPSCLSLDSSNNDSFDLPPHDLQAPPSTDSNIPSSYLRVDMASSAPGRSASDLDSSSDISSKKGSLENTNDLSATKGEGCHSQNSSPGASAASFGANAAVYPGAFAASANPMMFPPNGMMFYPIPVNFVQASSLPTGTGLMPVLTSMGGASFFMCPSTAASSLPVTIAQLANNISCPPGMAQATAAQSPGPLTATFDGSSAGRPSSVSVRQPNISGSLPPSYENNNSSSNCSYSLHPDSNTRLLRLRRPVLEWLQTKLDIHIRNNWEALADERGMLYEAIRAHNDRCRDMQESPFLKLLDTENFQNYTVGEFLQDMNSIKRKDIVIDFGDVLQKFQGAKDRQN